MKCNIKDKQYIKQNDGAPRKFRRAIIKELKKLSQDEFIKIAKEVIKEEIDKTEGDK